MNDCNNRLWNKIIRPKHKPFRIWRSLRNVKTNQVIRLDMVS